MKKKHRQQQTATFSPTELRPRIECARQEGRYQQALDLAKQLHKHEPTPAHLELLKEIYLGRARQLRSQGLTRDALTVLDVASQLGGQSPTWIERFAQELAQSGNVKASLALLSQLPDPADAQRILGHAIDAAIQQEAAGRAALPPELHADFDRIVLAFQQVETGEDEAARVTLQGIGLRSPFLEWKLLLRGLQAYWQNDDERARENWQRLSADRLPARLAAPFRGHVDAAFLSAQPPAVQAALQKQFDRLQDSRLLGLMRALQATLADRHKLATALRQAETLLPLLRQEAPHLVQRLAYCFYWAILDTGPDDVRRYLRVFGPPPDDLHFHRLQAIGYERAEMLHEAHHLWREYDREIASQPEKWPGTQGQHARALLWLRMGKNAASVPASGAKRRNPLSLFDDGGGSAALKPGAEKCFQNSLELAPDLLETHEALVRYHREGKREVKAEKAAHRLLKHFPAHVPTLEMLSDLRRKRGDYAAALEWIEQALKANALDRRLRRKVSDTYLLLAREHVESGQFDEARRQYQAALDLSSGTDGGMILAYGAACEFKAGDAARAEELIQQAMARAAPPVGVSYLLLTEVLRLKLDRSLKQRFEADLKVGLATPTPDGALFLSRILAGLQTGGVSYLGQKGHTQKALSYLYKTRNLDFTEPQLDELCRNLLDMESYPQARRFADLGERKYPQSAVFPYLHAMGWIRQKGPHVNTWQVVPMLKRAKQLAQAQPSNERRDNMLEDIEKRLRELNPFDLDMLSRMFGFGPDDESDTDDDW